MSSDRRFREIIVGIHSTDEFRRKWNVSCTLREKRFRFLIIFAEKIGWAMDAIAFALGNGTDYDEKPQNHFTVAVSDKDITIAEYDGEGNICIWIDLEFMTRRVPLNASRKNISKFIFMARLD